MTSSFSKVKVPNSYKKINVMAIDMTLTNLPIF